MAPPLNEVCDSEDEQEILSPVIRHVDHRVATDPSGEGAVLPAELDLKASTENSTASTGELLRQAHLDLMASTQSATDVAMPRMSTSPEMNRTKRRLSVTDAAPPPSLNGGKLKRIKTSPAVTSRRLDQDSTPEVFNLHRDEVATSDTIPGDTFPGQTTPGNTIPGDTIPGDTFPGGYSVQGQTPVAPTHKNSTQQTPSEHQSSSLTPWSESAVGNSSARGSNNNDISSDPLPSDDLLIGLPKEQYKPRPSRSRSEKVTVEVPLDYSIRPEKSTKAKRARTIDHSPLKTGSELETGPRLFPKNPILQAPDFEALSPPSAGCIQVGLAQVPELSPLDLPQTVSETSPDVRSSSTQVKNAAGKPASGKKRGRPRKNPLPEPVEDECTISQPSKSVHDQRESKGDVQVVISPRDQTPVVSTDSGLHQSGDSHALKILQALAQKFPARPSPSPERTESRSEQIVHEETIQAEPKDVHMGDEIDRKAEPEAIATTKKSSVATKASSAKAKATATKAKSAATKAKTAALKAAAKAQELALTKEDSPDPEEEKVEPAEEVLEANEQATEEKVMKSEVKEKKQALEEKEAEPTKTPAPAVKKPATARSSPATPSWQNRPIHRVGLSKTQKTQSLLKVFRGPR